MKIVLSLRWEHNFEGSGRPKIDLESDLDRRWVEKSMGAASGAVLGKACFALSRFLIDFRVPLGSQNGFFGATFG